MARIIGILSGKGGIGKTTLTSNLGYALTELGKNVALVDTNITTPHLGFHLGMHLAPKTLHDVLRGTIPIENATYSHPLGFKVVPGSISVNDLANVNVNNLPEVMAEFSNNSDFVLMDCAPALGKEAMTSLQTANEVILVTNPDLPSVTDALKTLKLANGLQKKVLGVVINRVKWRPEELKSWEIEEMLGVPALVEIPDDINIPKSIAAKVPVLDHAPNSPASTEIRRLAHWMVGKEFTSKTGYGFLDWLVGWMNR